MDVKNMKKKNSKTIGILGGMGPHASNELYRLLIEKSISIYGVKNNEDFPEILLNSIPVVDFISDTANIPKARQLLIERTKQLNIFGVSVLCIACNTAHLLIDDLRNVSSVPFISITDEVKTIVTEKKYQRIGLLASITTYETGLYNKLNSTGQKLFIPTSKFQLLLEDCIRAVIAGKISTQLKKKLNTSVQLFINENKLDVLILGCTELPLIFQKKINIPTINTLEVLAESLLRFYYE